MINRFNTVKSNEKPMSQVSMGQGYWYYFKHNDNDISIHGSTWSGKETVYLNNHLISSQRNVFSRTGKHEFVHENTRYKVILTMKHILLGKVEAHLYADDALVGSEVLAFFPGKKGNGVLSGWKGFALTAGSLFVAGVILGYSLFFFI